MKTLIGFSAFSICLSLGILFSYNLDNSAQTALEEFYNYKGFDDKRTEPLYKAKAKVTPLLIENVKNKNMPYRLRAIAFLGSNKINQALPVLTQIANDETEDNIHRQQALWAIFHIDENFAKKLAEEYKDKNDYLGIYANCILTEKVCF